MRNRPPAGLRLAALSLLAVMPLAAACGSGGDEPPAPAARTATTAPTEDTPTEPVGAPGDGGYCDALRDGVSALEAIEGTLGDPSAVDEGLSALEGIAAAAPDAVRDDWDAVVSFVEAAAGGDVTAVQGEAENAQAALARIETHARAECGMGLS